MHGRGLSRLRVTVRQRKHCEGYCEFIDGRSGAQARTQPLRRYFKRTRIVAIAGSLKPSLAGLFS